MIEDAAQRADRQAVRIETRGVGMDFDTNAVLDGVTIQVRAGETVGLIGENGAGKSTLLDIMCGVHRPTRGQVMIDGRTHLLSNPVDAARRGIYRVFQEQSLIPRLPVFVNLCFGAEDHFSTMGAFRKKQARDHAAAVLSEAGLDYDIDRTVSSYSFGDRQLLEIARALSLSRIYNTGSPTILLDEPTAALSGRELGLFFDLIGQLRSTETSFVFVSHRLRELLAHSDRLYVLKDGKVVAEVPPDTSETELHRLMVGREQAQDLYHKAQAQSAPSTVRLRVTDLSATGLAPTSFDVRSGEIVGVGGLLGSGKNQLAAAVFGAVDSGGTVEVDGKRMRHRMSDRVRAGVGYIPLHRHAEGASLGHSVALNVNEVGLGSGAMTRWRMPKRERAIAQEWTDRLRVRMRSLEQPVRTLSGGNQQKVVFAKWLSQGASVIIADNPTRGVDAGAKEEIYAILRELTAAGAAVLLISDDLPELIGLSDRILVMHDGAVTGELDSPATAPPREENVVSLMV